MPKPTCNWIFASGEKCGAVVSYCMDRDDDGRLYRKYQNLCTTHQILADQQDEEYPTHYPPLSTFNGAAFLEGGEPETQILDIKDRIDLALLHIELGQPAEIVIRTTLQIVDSAAIVEWCSFLLGHAGERRSL